MKWEFKRYGCHTTYLLSVLTNFHFVKICEDAHYLLQKSIMLIGEYTHTIDTKKRLSLPSKFRKELGNKVILTKGLDNCLFMYSVGEWKKISVKLAGLPFGQADTRGFNRFMLAGATEVAIDSLGRILVPDFLRDFASLKDKVALAGVQSRIEIWDEKKWSEYKKRIEKQADNMAEKLGEIGIL